MLNDLDRIDLILQGVEVVVVTREKEEAIWKPWLAVKNPFRSNWCWLPHVIVGLVSVREEVKQLNLSQQ